MTKNTMAFLCATLAGFLAGSSLKPLILSSVPEARADTIVEVYGEAIPESEIMCLAISTYHEARGENFAGRLATMNVIRNRVNSKDFPDSICEVTQQAKKDSKGRVIKNKCAFSFFCDGISDVPQDLVKFEQLENESRIFLEENSIDITEGSLFYHSISVSPNWKFHKVGRIGNHIFYR